MKKLNIALLISGMMLAGVAQANFDGFSVGAGLGMTHGKYKWDIEDTLTSEKESNSKSKSKFASQLDLNYTLPVYNDFVMGLGVTYGLNNIKYDVGVDYLKLKQHFSFYAAPGYLITPDVMVYGKLAYHHAKMEVVDYDHNYKGSYTRGGFGFGAGLSYALTPNFELGGEVQHVLFSKKNRPFGVDEKIEEKLRTTEFTVLVKYRF